MPHPTELTLRAGREVLLQGSPLPPPCSAKPLPTSGALRAVSPICTRLLRKSMTYSAGGASCRFTRSSWRWWEMKTRPGAETRSSCTRSRLMFRFLGKKNERPVSGGRCNTTGRPHGVIRYQYKANVIEEGRKGGQPHGLRVVCTQMGDIWIRLHKNGERLAQVVLHADLSENSSMAKDDGGLKTLRQHLHLIQDCFVNTGWPKQN